MTRERPIVYIASPYTEGDPGMNTHFQCMIFNQLLTEGRVWPVAPLWAHFQHMIFPRPYQDWVSYDNAFLKLYDVCLRLDSSLPALGYFKHESKGADREVESFEKMGKPVFHSISDLYAWIDSTWNTSME